MMTKQADKPAKGFDMNMAAPFAGMANFNEGILGAYAQAGKALLENAVSMNQELMRFAGERFQADVEALQKLTQCRNVQEMAEFQSSFAKSAAEAYQAEVARLTEQSTQATTAALKPLSDTVKTTGTASGR